MSTAAYNGVKYRCCAFVPVETDLIQFKEIIFQCANTEVEFRRVIEDLY